MIHSELRAALDGIKSDPAFFKEENFESRLECIDYLEFDLVQRIDHALLTDRASETLASLRQAAERLKHELECVNRRLFQRIRSEIRSGGCAGESFKALLSAYTGYTPDDADHEGEPGYDSLDAFVAGLLSSHVVPAETVPREPEMVMYQATPARVVFSLAERARFTRDDVFYDIGSGLGRVCILVNLVSGVPARGIEVEPTYCAYARTCAESLNLAQIAFIQADARAVDYTPGTVFFLYTPFRGAMLQAVLEQLQAVARARPIKLFTYGPCTLDVSRQAWLACAERQASTPQRLAEFRSL